MANHKSAIKRIAQNAKRAARNKHYKSTMRTYIKRVRQAVEAGDKDTADLFTGISRAVDKMLWFVESHNQ